MNRQAVYETVRRHLLTQNERAKPAGFSSGCYYRTAEGLKCAVGCLIPDAFYSPGLEACVVDAQKPNAKILRTILSTVIDDFDTNPQGSDVQFLRGLQSIHDTNEPEHWPKLLKEFAAQNGIEP